MDFTMVVYYLADIVSSFGLIQVFAVLFIIGFLFVLVIDL